MHQCRIKVFKRKFAECWEMNRGLSPLSSLPEDPTQIGKGISLITVLDINDNAPVFAIDYETLLCENAMPGQVRLSKAAAAGPTSTSFSLSPLAWSLTHKDSLLTLKAIKTLSCSSKQVHCAHIRFTARGHSRETASLVWDTSLRFNSTYCRCYRSLEKLLSFRTVKAG